VRADDASTMTTYVLSSESDVPVEVIAGPMTNIPRALSASPRLDTDEPDWVKHYTPSRPTRAPVSSRPARARSRRTLVSLDDDNDDDGDDVDSVMNLIGDTDDDDDHLPLVSTGSTEPAGNTETATGPGSSQTLPRKAMAPGQAHRASAAVAGKGSSKSRSRLPLVTAPKLDENVVLVQAQSAVFDLSGDVGAVGRVKVDESGVLLDIKGVLYSCGLHDINTVCIVTVGDDEARISAVLDEVVTLHQDESTFGCGGETLVSGALYEDNASGEDGDDDMEETRAKTKAKPRPKVLKVVKPKTKAKPRAKVKPKPKPRAKAAM
jgi:hypothetical protein